MQPRHAAEADATGGIVVGVDGSAESGRAVAWAGRWARRLGVGLRLVTALPAGGGEALGTRRREAAHRDLLVRIAWLSGSYPEVPVTAEVVLGSPVGSLVAASRDSVAVVLGTRAPQARRGLFTQSVAGDVSALAHCPVVVIPPGAGDPECEGPILVGVDGSVESAEAAEFAFAYAAEVGVHVVALHVHEEPDEPGSTLAEIAAERGELRRQAQRALAEVLDPLRSAWPQVGVVTLVWGGPTAELLAQAGADAALSVVGSRGHGGVAGLLLGSTSRELLSLATCPVAVVRAAGVGGPGRGVRSRLAFR